MASLIARYIMADLNHQYSKVVYLCPRNKKERSCRCLICGQLLPSLLYAHAQKHGYESKVDMIAHGKIEWL